MSDQCDNSWEQFLVEDYWLQPPLTHLWAGASCIACADQPDQTDPLGNPVTLSGNTCGSFLEDSQPMDSLSDNGGDTLHDYGSETCSLVGKGIVSDYSGFKIVPQYSPRFTYYSTDCATCQHPLETSQILANFDYPSLECTHSDSPDHAPLRCDAQGCGQLFPDFSALKAHSRNFYHQSFWCTVLGCLARLSSSTSEISKHYDQHHPNTHYSCAQCGKQYRKRSYLDHHGLVTSHAVYICQYSACGSEACQATDLIRHQRVHQAKAKRYPCPHCRKYRGDNGFKRKDHLRQHLRNYHHIDEDRSFRCLECYNTTFTDIDMFSTHMFEKHASKPFFCREHECDRVLMNGFDTEDALKTHVKDEHMPEFPCQHAGCDRVGKKGYRRRNALVKHVKKEHGGESTDV